MYQGNLVLVFNNSQIATEFANRAKQTRINYKSNKITETSLDGFISYKLINDAKKFKPQIDFNRILHSNLQTSLSNIDKLYTLYVTYFTTFSGKIKIALPTQISREKICHDLYKEEYSKHSIDNTDNLYISNLFYMLTQTLVKSVTEKLIINQVLAKISELKETLITLNNTLDNAGNFNDKRIFTECIYIIERIIFHYKTSGDDNKFLFCNFLIIQNFDCCIDGIRGRLYMAENQLKSNFSNLQEYSIEQVIRNIILSGEFANEFMKVYFGSNHKESASLITYLQKKILSIFSKEPLTENDDILLSTVKNHVEEELLNLDKFIEQHLPYMIFKEFHQLILLQATIAIIKDDFQKFELLMSAIDLDFKRIKLMYSCPETLAINLSEILLTFMLRKGAISEKNHSNRIQIECSMEAEYHENFILRWLGWREFINEFAPIS